MITYFQRLIPFEFHQETMVVYLFVLYFAKAAIRFVVRCSILKPANLHLHFWTRWKKITYFWKCIRFVIWNVKVSLKVHLPFGEIVISLQRPTRRRSNIPAIGPEDV